MGTTTKKLAQFVVETGFGDFPPETVELAKTLVFKGIAGMLAGCTQPVSRKITKYVRELGGPGQAGVMAAGFRAPAENASLALGTFSHGAELEDDSYPSIVSTVTVLPVVLALGQKFYSSGRDVLEGFILGYEVQGRVALGSAPRAAEMGICPLSFYGPLGAAVAAAKIMGLNVEETRHALSIAASQASGLIVQGAWMAHPLETGLACRAGVLAAALAKEGVNGCPDIIEHPMGLSNVLGKGNYNLDTMTKNLGRPFYIHSVFIKKYPCCFFTHPAIDALFAVFKEHRLSYDQVESIELQVNPVQAERCDHQEPADAEGSKFSYQHCLAGVMLDGKVGLDTFTEAKVSDPLFREARKKVRVVATSKPTWTLPPGPVKLIATLRSGQEVKTTFNQPIGGPEIPLPREDLLALCRDLARLVLSEQQVERVERLAMNLENVSRVAELMDVVTFLGEPGWC